MRDDLVLSTELPGLADDREVMEAIAAVITSAAALLRLMHKRYETTPRGPANEATTLAITFSTGIETRLAVVTGLGSELLIAHIR